jgi:L-serine/L-threonine ammonia-lyase
LDKISTIAASLGAMAVTPTLLTSSIKTHSHVVTDRQAVEGCYDYLTDYRVLTEPACGAALSAVYRTSATWLAAVPALNNVQNVCVIVCGGNSVNLQSMLTWIDEFQIR